MAHTNGAAAARLDYRSLLEAGIARDPPDVHSAKIHRAYTGSLNQVAVVFVDPMTQTMVETGTIVPNLVRADPADWTRVAHDAPQAYMKCGKEAIRFGQQRDVNWGVLIPMVILPLRGQNTFAAPLQGEANFVMVKRLRKDVLHPYLDSGGTENPYKEVALMQQLGDDNHVLKCVECLEDDDHLYIITRLACSEGTLQDVILGYIQDVHSIRGVMDVDRARNIFRKILDILLYLVERGICHRDLSPCNLLFLSPDNLVVFDFASSAQLPTNEATGQRALLRHRPFEGKACWMCHEVYSGGQYDGPHMDLYAAGLILYYLCTGLILYEKPCSDMSSNEFDVSYIYFIAGEGLAHTPTSLVQGARISGLQAVPTEISRKTAAHAATDLHAMNILIQLLKHEPADRICLSQAREAPFVTQEQNINGNDDV
jgi:Protein kinase domain